MRSQRTEEIAAPMIIQQSRQQKYIICRILRNTTNIAKYTCKGVFLDEDVNNGRQSCCGICIVRIYGSRCDFPYNAVVTDG